MILITIHENLVSFGGGLSHPGTRWSKWVFQTLKRAIMALIVSTLVILITINLNFVSFGGWPGLSYPGTGWSKWGYLQYCSNLPANTSNLHEIINHIVIIVSYFNGI